MALPAMRDEPTLGSVAREALDDAKGNVLSATGIMTNRMMTDTALYRLLMFDVIRTACYAAVTAQARAERRVIWHSKQPTIEEQKGRVRDRSVGIIRTLMDFNLPGGVRLGDARREDILTAINNYTGYIGDMLIKRRWLELILPHVRGKKKVSQVLTPTDLVKFQEEARNAG